MSLHEGNASLLRVKTGPRGRPAIVWGAWRFDASGDPVLIAKSHAELAITGKSSGVYSLTTPKCALYIPAGPPALIMPDATAVAPEPHYRLVDSVAGTLQAVWLDASTVVPEDAIGTVLLLGMTGA